MQKGRTEVRPFGFLLGAEDPVAGVTQARDDVGMVVQLLVAGSDVDIHVGMGLLDSGDALRTADDIHHDDVSAAMLLQEINGCHGAAAGGQHGIHHEGDPVADVLRQLAVILHRQGTAT